MRLPYLGLALILALTSAGCGADSGLVPCGAGGWKSWAQIRVLDPEGRLHIDHDRLRVFFQEADGSSTTMATGGHHAPVFLFEEKPGRSGDVFVLAPGCTPTRVPLREGETIVRLEPGIPVFLAVPKHPVFEKFSSMSFTAGLERRATFPPGTRAHNLHAAPTYLLELDMPVPGFDGPIREPERLVRLSAPGPGSYVVRWGASAGNQSYGSSDRDLTIDIDVDDVDRVFHVDPRVLEMTLQRALSENR